MSFFVQLINLSLHAQVEDHRDVSRWQQVIDHIWELCEPFKLIGHHEFLTSRQNVSPWELCIKMVPYFFVSFHEIINLNIEGLPHSPLMLIIVLALRNDVLIYKILDSFKLILDLTRSKVLLNWTANNILHELISN